MHARYLQVAFDVPLRRFFDYVCGEQYSHIDIQPGTRVRVPFGSRRDQVGIVTGTSTTTSVPEAKLKPLGQVIDNQPLFDQQHLRLLLRISDYYQHPPGEVIFTALPAGLRQGKPAEITPELVYVTTATGTGCNPDTLGRAGKQKQILMDLQTRPGGLTRAELGKIHGKCTAQLKALVDAGLIEKRSAGTEAKKCPGAEIILNDEQSDALTSICRDIGKFNVRLLQGITGSGKTEVYIEAIRKVLQQKLQALILVPEIGLTPKFLQRLQDRLPVAITVLHSGLGETARLQSWLAAAAGNAAVIIGTRSAVWTPLKNPGLFIVDEEHDSSYKQDDGFRYNARDVAIMRAQAAATPVLLGSATPSLESLHNTVSGRFSVSKLRTRASGSAIPKIRIINLQNQKIRGAFSESLLAALAENLQRGNQSLLFLNRRGYSPALLCHGCGWIAGCERCSINMTWHKNKSRLICHHCNKQQPFPEQCPECGCTRLIEAGHGTQRISQTIKQHFPDARVLRVDRDSTRRQGSMAEIIRQVEYGEVDILVGTQILAKGHHFPGVTLAGIVDADSGLLSADFRATERMSQLITQVSGRAGRAEKPGVVYIQTHYPGHPVLQALLQNDYAGLAKHLLAERRLTGLPPYSHLALLRAESTDNDLPQQFLQQARTAIEEADPGLEIFGPFTSPMEKKQGRFRHQLLLQTGNRNNFRRALPGWLKQLEGMQGNRKVRWSLDIDPQDML